MTSQNLRSFGKSCAKRSFWALGLGIALMAALPGCVAHAEGALVADYPADYVESVPPRIEYYPRTYYRGSPAYLVDGRWYYRTHDRWIVFREEPTELREYRVRRSPAYLAPSNRYYGRSQERISAERRADERRAEERRIDERRAQARHDAERRADEDRRRSRYEAERAAEQRRAEQRRDAQRAEQQRRFDQQRAAERRADDEHRVAERQGRPTRKRDRSHGDQKDYRDERDRRHLRQD
jgi:hypothetical protein